MRHYRRRYSVRFPGLGGTINLQFPLPNPPYGKGEYWGEELNDGLNEYYDPDLVYSHGRGPVYGKRYFMSVDVDSSTAELEVDPEKFLKEVAAISKRILLRAIPELQANDIYIKIILDNERLYATPGYVG